MRLPFIAPVVSLLAALALPAGAQQTPPATPRSTSALPVVPGARVRISATTLVSPVAAHRLTGGADTYPFGL